MKVSKARERRGWVDSPLATPPPGNSSRCVFTPSGRVGTNFSVCTSGGSNDRYGWISSSDRGPETVRAAVGTERCRCLLRDELSWEQMS